MTSQIIQPESSISLNWTLTIEGKPTERETLSAEFRRGMTCPSDDGIFVIKSGNIVLRNLLFQGCDFEKETNVDALIRTEDCVSDDISEVRLEDIDFFQNRNLNGSVGLHVKQPSCYRVAMKNVRFDYNWYSKTAFLASRNELEDVYWLKNTFDGESTVDDGFFAFPKGSNTKASFLFAKNNVGSLMNIQNGTIYIKNSSFTENECKCYGVVMGTAINVEIAFASFVSNRCIKNGAAISFNQSQNIFLHHLNFTQNKASEGGAIFLKDPANVEIEDCHFRSNEANNEGGSIHAFCTERKILKSWSVRDSYFQGNRAEYGGAISASSCNETVVTIRNVHFLNNSATESGGALCISESHNLAFRAIDVFFTLNSASIAGSTRFYNVAGLLSFENVTFDQNSCKNFVGGGFFFESVHENNAVSFRNSSFFQNEASIAGGAIYVDSEDLKLGIFASRFQGNKAGTEGGALYINAIKRLRIDDSSFSKNFALSHGGAAVMWNVGFNSFIRQNVFEQNKAGNGGAITIYGSDTNLTSCTFQGNEAIENGGAVEILDVVNFCSFVNTSFFDNFAESGGGIYSSRTTRTEIDCCTFEGNRVALYGGGLLACLSDIQETTRLRSSSFVNNEAYIGGDHLHSKRSADSVSGGACFQFSKYDLDGWLHEKVVSIEGTGFFNDTARRAGGGFFIERREALYIDSELTELKPFDPEEGALSNNVQSSLFGQNVVLDGYGPNVATTRTHFFCNLIYLNGTKISMVEGDLASILDWKSGYPLPVIQIVAMDYFYQGPALTKSISLTADSLNSNERYSGYARAMLRPIDGLLPNDLVTDISSGEGNITIGGPLDVPGLYYLALWLGDDQDVKIMIAIELRNCKINEHPMLERKYCEECDLEHFNFDPLNNTSACRQCPSNCMCEHWGMLPIDGYWLRHPCSEKPAQRCAFESACQFANRSSKLDLFFSETVPIPTCNLTSTQISDFQKTQCAEGYEGPLCGSCSDTYGYFDSECSPCKRIFYVYLWFVANAVWTFIVCATVLFGNLMEVGPEMSNELVMPLLHRTPFNQFSTEDLDESIDIAQRNMNETIKILINFAQISSMALVIDEEWSYTIRKTMHFIDFMGAVSVKTTLSLDCMFPDHGSVPGSINSTLLSLLVPLCTLVIFVGYWYLRSSSDTKMLARRLVLSTVVVFYVSYIGWAEQLSIALKCVDIEEQDGTILSLWARDTSVQCNSGSHAVLTFLLVIPMIFVVLVAFPLLSASYLFAKRNTKELESVHVKEMFGFMYAAYKEDCVFWDCYILVRKASLALIIVFGASMGSNVTAITAICVLIFSLYLQARLLPYKDEYKTLNSGEVFSLLVSIFIFISVLYFNDPSVDVAGKVTVTLFAIIFIVSFVIYILFQTYLKTVIFCRMSLIRNGIYLPSTETGIKVILAWIRNREIIPSFA